VTAIQPCALLLLVGPDWRIETVSANAAMLGDHRPIELVGQPLADLIGSKAIHSLRNRMSWLSSGESEVQDYGAQWGDVLLDVRATHDSEHYLIEAELAVEPRLPDAIGMVRSMADRLSGNKPPDLAEQAMRQLNALTGYDHVMLVDRRGAVVATADRGKQVPLDPSCVEIARLTADRNAEPVPLVGKLDSTLLARAAYLAPPVEECERLSELGIGATMALPLRIDGELVAALHAHHPTPRRCGLERRAIAHLFAERLVARMARCGWQP
jgi:light-regulated signal transduction histidine kinase (bacteriophytochrome)